MRGPGLDHLEPVEERPEALLLEHLDHGLARVVVRELLAGEAKLLRRVGERVRPALDDDLVLEDNLDKNRSSVNILRTSFIYEKQYFQMETCTNIPGGPTFLRLENHQNGDVKIPPFVRILHDVTGDDYYATKRIARPGFKMKS